MSDTIRSRSKGRINYGKEDDGYLLQVVYNGFDHNSELQVYRADDVTDRVCNLKLKHHAPHKFHGYFSKEVFAA